MTVQPALDLPTILEDAGATAARVDELRAGVPVAKVLLLARYHAGEGCLSCAATVEILEAWQAGQAIAP